MLLAINTMATLTSLVVFLAVIIILVIILLIAKRYLVASGNVKIRLNGEKDVEVAAGGSLLNAMATSGIFLPSACGGKGSCGQCRCQVDEGGGEILPTETVHFSRKQMKDNWRLGCQVKVKGDMAIIGPRPLLVQYLPLYSKEQARRHDVRPGITGWAQCHGRNNLTWTKKFELDVWYVDHVSFKTDCQVVFTTAMKVLKRADIDNDNVEKKQYTTPLFDGTN